MSIRLVFVAFVLTIFAVLLRIMPNNPLHPTRANQSSGLLSHFCGSACIETSSFSHANEDDAADQRSCISPTAESAC
jgi:hypothetical protein